MIREFGSLTFVSTTLPKAAPRLWSRAVLALLLILGVVVLSLCHTAVAPHGDSVSATATSVQTYGSTTASPDVHGEEHGHCDEGSTPLADQRTGSLSASALLGLGIFAFVGLPVFPPRLTSTPARAERRRALPLGGTRALVSLCVRRV